MRWLNLLAHFGVSPESSPKSLFGARSPKAKALIVRQTLYNLDLQSELSGTCQYRTLAPIQANGEPLQADALCSCICENRIFFVRPRHFTSPCPTSRSGRKGPGNCAQHAER